MSGTVASSVFFYLPTGGRFEKNLWRIIHFPNWHIRLEGGGGEGEAWFHLYCTLKRAVMLLCGNVNGNLSLVLLISLYVDNFGIAAVQYIMRGSLSRVQTLHSFWSVSETEGTFVYFTRQMEWRTYFLLPF